jgi:hypothetical protein
MRYDHPMAERSLLANFWRTKNQALKKNLV